MPRKRSDMRRVKEVLRLAHELGYSLRQIAESVRLGRTSVRDYLARADAAGVRYEDVAEQGRGGDRGAAVPASRAGGVNIASRLTEIDQQPDRDHCQDASRNAEHDDAQAGIHAGRCQAPSLAPSPMPKVTVRLLLSWPMSGAIAVPVANTPRTRKDRHGKCRPGMAPSRIIGYARFSHCARVYRVRWSGLPRRWKRLGGPFCKSTWKGTGGERRGQPASGSAAGERLRDYLQTDILAGGSYPSSSSCQSGFGRFFHARRTPRLASAQFIIEAEA